MVESICLAFFTMLSDDRVKSLAEVAQKAADLDGEFWDVGCNGGGSAAVMKDAAPKKQIHLFDSFEGLPESTDEDGQHGRETPIGEFSIPYQDFLRRLGIIHKGWVPATFKGLEGSKIALAHVDLDYYKGTKEALQFILPRIILNGYVIVDDYDSRWVGVKPATDEVIGRNFTKLEAPLEQAIFQCTAIL
jgi:O-methyltransferase